MPTASLQLQRRPSLVTPRTGGASCRFAFCRCLSTRARSQHRGVSDHHFGPHGLPSLRPARWSLTPRCPASAEPAVIGGGVEQAQISVVILGRRGVIVRLATRALKALRESFIPLRPRCARLTALTARVASLFLAMIYGRHMATTSWRYHPFRCLNGQPCLLPGKS